MNTPLPPLPALKNLGELADRHPVIVIDSREQWPLPIRRLPTVRAGLYSGDYSVAGFENLFAVEKKFLDDLTSCCTTTNRERFEHELHRLRGFSFKRLLIIGTREQVETGDYTSRITPQAVMGTLAAFEIRYDIPIVWADTPEAGAHMIETWSWYFTREQIQGVNELFRHTQPAAGRQA